MSAGQAGSLSYGLFSQLLHHLLGDGLDLCGIAIGLF